jgi:hypothetical protein
MEINKIKELKNKHSCGVYVKYAPPSFVKNLLINQSFTTGGFRVALKIALNKPIPKTGVLTDPGL